MIALKKYLKKPVGKKESTICAITLVIYIVFALLGDSVKFFGIDSCYEGFFADVSEKYVSSCENSIREQCGTKSGLDQTCVEYVKTHTPLNVIIGRIFLVVDIALLAVMFSEYRSAAVTAALALTVNISFIWVQYLYYAQRFIGSFAKPLSITLITAFYLYLFSFILREQLTDRGRA